MPANAGIDDGGASLFHFLRQMDHLLPGTALVHQVDHGQPVDDDEILAHGLADAAENLEGQADAVLEGPAPAVGSVVGPARNELVDEVAFRAHDLDPVIARLAGQTGAAGIVIDLTLNFLVGQFTGLVGIDRCLDGRWRDRFRV